VSVEQESTEQQRRARNWAAAALLVLLTSAWLPWWLVRYATSGTAATTTYSSRLFGADPGVASAMYALSSGVLLATAVLWLLVRLAGRSFVYEPVIWQRDLLIQQALVAAAMGVVFAWPLAGFRFWAERQYGLNDTAAVLTETTLPGLGFWLALVGVVLLQVSWQIGRSQEISES
jgi:hypothetical protein